MKKRRLSLAGLSLMIFITYSCREKSSDIIPSFCYWKTSFRLDRNEAQLCKDLGVKHFYLRLFDVEWSPEESQAIPVGKLNLDYNADLNQLITPVIFISNQVMSKSDTTGLDSLANRIARITEYYMKEIRYIYTRTLVDKLEYSPNYAYYQRIDSLTVKTWEIWKEKTADILIDCDWSQGTGPKYFHFLELLKKRMPHRRVLSTLRLWQYRNQTLAGIPPVEKCLLMCYSVGNPRNYAERNSIASCDEIKKYMDGGKYPLDLDFALPVYHWGIIFRNQQFKGIFNIDYPEKLISDTTTYLPVGENRFVFKTDTVIGSTYLRYGDELRIEKVKKDEMEKIIHLLKKKAEIRKNTVITLFSWDTVYVRNYGSENTKAIFSHYN